MKNKFLVITMLASFIFVSCTKESADATDANTVSVQSNLTGEKSNEEGAVRPVPAPAPLWTIGSFIVSGNEEAGTLKSFSFRFDSNNMVTATDGLVVVYGKWYMSAPDLLSIYFDLSGVPDYMLTQTFSELSDDWKILKQSSYSIFLEAGIYKNKKELRFDRKF